MQFSETVLDAVLLGIVVVFVISAVFMLHKVALEELWDVEGNQAIDRQVIVRQ